MMDSEPTLTLIIAIIGVATGLAALIWQMWDRLWDRFVSYLHIKVSVDSEYNDYVTVITTVENRSVMKKKLDNALLLIGLEKESPLATMREITGENFCSTNQIAKYCANDTGIQSGPNGRCLIPIRFYYFENVWVRDEIMSYRVPVDIKNMEKGVPYSVRFFIDTPGRPHRSTQDCFILPTRDDG